MDELLRSTALLLVLLNPFLVIVYLISVVRKLNQRQFAEVMLRAAAIAVVVYCCFALVGDAIFSRLIQAEFASFQIFGGVVFLLIGLQFLFRGPEAIEFLRGESEHLAGAIAMPILIGPGTISACVVVGKRHDPLTSCGIILVTVAVSITVMIGLKILHDVLRPRNSRLVERYIEIAGRISALYAGTVAIDMIMQGALTWSEKF